jgi:hypothetical protein
MLEELSDADEWEASLADVAPRRGLRLRYTYDYGDNWEHDTVVEQVGPPVPDMRYSVCVAGRHAGPRTIAAGSGDTPICWRRWPTLTIPSTIG